MGIGSTKNICANTHSIFTSSSTPTWFMKNTHTKIKIKKKRKEGRFLSEKQEKVAPRIID
jgi:hypothetical protein